MITIIIIIIISSSSSGSSSSCSSSSNLKCFSMFMYLSLRSCHENYLCTAIGLDRTIILFSFFNHLAESV